MKNTYRKIMKNDYFLKAGIRMNKILFMRDENIPSKFQNNLILIFGLNLFYSKIASLNARHTKQ